MFKRLKRLFGKEEAEFGFYYDEDHVEVEDSAPPNTVAKTYEVTLWEMDSWSGSKKLATHYFATEKDRREYINGINSQNNEDITPEYYIYAEATN